MFKDKLTDLHRQLWGDHARTDCPHCFNWWLAQRLAAMRSRMELLELERQEAGDGRQR